MAESTPNVLRLERRVADLEELVAELRRRVQALEQKDA